MRIGLMSDTHGNRTATLKAIAALRDRGAEAVIHAGDIGNTGVLDDLMEHFGLRGIRVFCVLGNVDLYDGDLNGGYNETNGVEVRRRFPRLDLGGWAIGVAHGDDPRILDQLLDDETLDLVVTGHTHVAEDRPDRKPRLINPGAVVRASIPSVALLDTTDGSLEIIPLGR